MEPAAIPPAPRPAPAFWYQLNTVVAGVALGVVSAPLFYELLTAAGWLTPIEVPHSGCGDNALQWFQLWLGLGWGAAVGLGVAGAQALLRRRWAFAAVVLDLVALYLSAMLAGYGLVKVLGTQFPRLWANLDTPPVELTPMRVAWQFFGYSSGYQQFLGWGEVIPAGLLLWRRTRTLGAFIAAVVMLNVFVLNLFFDVCVKIGSGTYLGLALLLLLQDADRLWQFFILHRPAAPRTLPTTAARFGRRGRWVYRGLGVLLTAAAGLVLWQQWQQTVGYAAEQTRELPVQGVWDTTRASRWTPAGWQPVMPGDSAWPVRVYLQSGQAVLRNATRRDRHLLAPDPTQPTRRIVLTRLNQHNDQFMPVNWAFTRLSPDSLRLEGRWAQDSLRLTLGRRLDLMK